MQSWKLAAGIGAGLLALGAALAWSKKSSAASSTSVQPGYVPSWKRLMPLGGKYKFESGQIYGVAIPLGGSAVNVEATRASLNSMGLVMLDATSTPPHGWPNAHHGVEGYMVFTTETDKTFPEDDWGTIFVLA
jgi:hypothetical protein